jgi:hypothetical protein
MPVSDEMRERILEGIGERSQGEIVNGVMALLTTRYVSIRSMMIPELPPPEEICRTNPDGSPIIGEGGAMMVDPDKLRPIVEAMVRDREIGGRQLSDIRLPADLNFQFQGQNITFSAGQSLDEALNSITTRFGGVSDRIGNAIADGMAEDPSPSGGDLFSGFQAAMANENPRFAHLGFTDRIQAYIIEAKFAERRDGIVESLMELAANDGEVRQVLERMGNGNLEQGIESVLVGLEAAAFESRGISLPEASKPEDMFTDMPLQTAAAHQTEVDTAIRRKIYDMFGLSDNGTSLIGDPALSPEMRSTFNLLATASGGKINKSKHKEFADMLAETAGMIQSQGLGVDAVKGVLQTRLQNQFHLNAQQAGVIADRLAPTLVAGVTNPTAPATGMGTMTEAALSAQVRPQIQTTLTNMGSGPNSALVNLIHIPATAGLISDSIAAVYAEPRTYDLTPAQFQERLSAQITNKLPADMTTIFKLDSFPEILRPALTATLNKPETKAKVAAFIAAAYTDPASAETAAAKTALLNHIADDIKPGIRGLVDTKWDEGLAGLSARERNGLNSAFNADKQNDIKTDITNAFADMLRTGTMPTAADMQTRIQQALTRSIPDGDVITLDPGGAEGVVAEGRVTPSELRRYIAALVTSKIIGGDAPTLDYSVRPTITGTVGATILNPIAGAVAIGSRIFGR